MKYKLKEICNSISETYRRDDPFVILINTSDVFDGRILNHTLTDNKNLRGQFKKTFKKDDILFSEIRPANRHFAIVGMAGTSNYIASTKLMVIRADATKVRPKYLYYYLTSKGVLDELQHQAESRSGTFPQITFSTELANREIDLPSFVVQDKIVNIIDAINDKIELNERINDNLAEQAQAIYYDIFIANASHSWQSGHLSDLITVRYGKDHKKLASGSYPVYGSGGIMRYVERSLYDKESVLIPRKGTLNNVMYVNEPFWSVDTMFYTEMKLPNVAKFVFHFVKSKDLASLNAGSAVPSMTTDILNAMKLSIPDEDTFIKFENIVAPMYRTMQQNNRESSKLAELRDSMLPRLMFGELDVSEVDI